MLIDVASVIHPNMRSYNVRSMSFVTRIIHSCLSKQNLNTKSLKEEELVGLSKYLPYNIWSMLFLEGKRYNINNDIIYHDN